MVAVYAVIVCGLSPNIALVVSMLIPAVWAVAGARGACLIRVPVELTCVTPHGFLFCYLDPDPLTLIDIVCWGYVKWQFGQGECYQHNLFVFAYVVGL